MVNRQEIERRIWAYQFALLELGLYLDTHPCDQQAMQLRDIYKERLGKLIAEYEQCYGRYILTAQDVGDSWKEWVNSPWPWETNKGGCC